MKETRFIAQNKEKWLESETLLTAPEKDPEKLSNLFTQVIDDLSYSRTYYPNRSVRVYLNKIAREYFSIIYSHSKEKKNRFTLFWLDELPQIVLFCRKQLLISLFIFLVSAAIGVFSSYKDPQFTSTILGQSYIDMTKENIQNGDPMAVYKKGHQVDMFLGITMNNLMVAFRTYVFGIFLSIGSIAILMYNGIMVGCFQYFFVEKGLFVQSALSIWLHGTLEISSIILAGGAGLTLGSGLIFPGTYSRLQAFQISAMRSLKLMLGISPIFVIAGIIESFLTRYTGAPDLLKLFLILISAGLIIGYFVVFPWLKSKKGFDVPIQEVRLPPNTLETVHYDRIKNNAEIIKDAFLFYRKNSGKMLPWIAGITLLMTASYMFLRPLQGGVRASWDNYTFYRELFYVLHMPDLPYVLVNTVGVSILLYRIFSLVDNDFKKVTKQRVAWGVLIMTLPIMGALFLSVYLGAWGVFFLIFTYILYMMWAFIQLVERTNLLAALSRTFSIAGANIGQVTALHFILLLMSVSFLLVLSAPILYFNTTVLEWNFAATDEWARGIIQFVEIYIKLIGFNLILPILAASSAYLYFCLAEIQSADNLKKAIATVGSKNVKERKR